MCFNTDNLSWLCTLIGHSKLQHLISQRENNIYSMAKSQSITFDSWHNFETTNLQWIAFHYFHCRNIIKMKLALPFISKDLASIYALWKFIISKDHSQCQECRRPPANNIFWRHNLKISPLIKIQDEGFPWNNTNPYKNALLATKYISLILLLAQKILDLNIIKQNSCQSILAVFYPLMCKVHFKFISNSSNSFCGPMRN